MTATVGLGPNSPWTAVVRRVSADMLLSYVHQQWTNYASACTALGVSLQARKEPDLTKALQAQLAKAALAGHQPFDGDFIAEHERFDLDPTTMLPVCESRTDIEWLLSGFPRFTIEFKLLDGGAGLRTRYWQQGLAKFVSGAYAPHSHEGAMWAFLRTAGYVDGPKIRALVDKRAIQLSSVDAANPTSAPSALCTLALFDSAHSRTSSPSPLRLAHLFVALP